MKKLLGILFLLVFGPIAVFAQGAYTTSQISAQRLVDASKNPLNGTILVTLTDNTDTPVTYTPQGGSPSTATFSANVRNGQIQPVAAIPFAVPAAATTTPTGILYRIQVIQTGGTIIFTLPLTPISVQYYSLDAYIAQPTLPTTGSGPPVIPACAPGAQYTDTLAPGVPYACSSLEQSGSNVWTQNPSQNPKCSGAVAYPFTGPPYCVASTAAFLLPGYSITNNAALPAAPTAGVSSAGAGLPPNAVLINSSPSGTGQKVFIDQSLNLDGSNILSATGEMNGQQVSGVQSNTTTQIAINNAAASGGSVYVPPTFTGNNSYLQGTPATATAGCTVNSLTGSLQGTLNLFAANLGNKYLSAPTVTVTPINPSLNPGWTASFTAVLGTGSQAGQVVSYTGTSSNWVPYSDVNGLCPATITVAPPPTQAAFAPIIDFSHGATTYVPVGRIDDFGAKGYDTPQDSSTAVDSTDAIMNAMYAVTSNGTRYGKVQFTAGKYYYTKKLSGFYVGAGTDGIIPVAAILSVTTDSLGHTTSCNVIDPGKYLATSTLTFTAGGSGGVTSTLNTTSHTITACNATGVGTGLPVSSTFNVLSGPTCGVTKGLPATQCVVTAPDTPALIGYDIGVPSFLDIEMNYSTLDCGFTSALEQAASYTDSTFPYSGCFGSNRVSTGAIHVSLEHANFTNAFYDIVNLGSYWNVSDISTTGGGYALGNNAQFDTFVNVGQKVQGNTLGGFNLGSTFVSRAPTTGITASAITNSNNLIDDLVINNAQTFGVPRYTDIPGGLTGLQIIQNVMTAWNCWNDRNGFQSYRMGNPYTEGCGTEPGGVQSMTDQDIAANPTYGMWRGALPFIAAYTHDGRPTNSIILTNIKCKGNPYYCIVLGPKNNQRQVSVAPSENSGKCNGTINYGAPTCPNPYEPWATTVPSVMLVTETGNDGSIIPVSGVQRGVSYPWQLASVSATGNSVTSPNTFDLYPFAPDVFNNNPVQPVGVPTFTAASPNNNYQGNTLLPSDSTEVVESGERMLSGTFLADKWIHRVNNQNNLPGSPSWLEWTYVFNNATTAPGNMSMKFPGSIDRPEPLAGGNVTGLVVSTVGLGYAPGSRVGCSMTASPQALETNSGLFYQATCQCQTSALGVLSCSLGARAKGYVTAPTVTIDAPPAGGTQAVYTATINVADDFHPVVHNFYTYTIMPATYTIPGNSTSKILNVNCSGSIFLSGTTGRTDSVYVEQPGATGGKNGLLTEDSFVSANNTCTIVLHNPTPNSITTATGTATNPWTLWIHGTDAITAATTSSSATATNTTPYLAPGSGASGVATLTATTPLVVSASTGAVVVSCPTCVTSATSGLTSFNGRTTPAAVPTSGDYSFSQISGNPTVAQIAAAGTLTNNTSGNAANITGIAAVANGGTGTATPGLIAGANISISGTWPNQTITASITGITALTGDGTATGPGSAAFTLATVNSSVGLCGDATHVAQVTLNAKGLATLCTPILITGGGSVSGTGTSGFMTRWTGASTIANSALTDDLTHLVYTGTDFSAPIIKTNGSGPGTYVWTAGTGTYSIPANSFGIIAPATGGTSYLMRPPSTATAGIPHWVAPVTGASGSLEEIFTIAAINLASADVTGLLSHGNIAPTAVTPGSYTNANITVGPDGSLTAAANGAGSTLTGATGQGLYFSAANTPTATSDITHTGAATTSNIGIGNATPVGQLDIIANEVHQGVGPATNPTLTTALAAAGTSAVLSACTGCSPNGGYVLIGHLNNDPEILSYSGISGGNTLTGLVRSLYATTAPTSHAIGDDVVFIEEIHGVKTAAPWMIKYWNGAVQFLPTTSFYQNGGVTSPGSLGVNGNIYTTNCFSLGSPGGAGICGSGGGVAVQNASSAVIGTFDTNGNLIVPKTTSSTQFIPTGTAPTMAAGAAAGTSPSCTTVAAGSTNQAGVVTCTMGSTGTVGNATLATITFNGTLTVAPQGCGLEARNAVSAALYTDVLTTAPTTTTWTIAIGATAPTVSAVYSWSYKCM